MKIVERKTKTTINKEAIRHNADLDRKIQQYMNNALHNCSQPAYLFPNYRPGVRPSLSYKSEEVMSWDETEEDFVQRLKNVVQILMNDKGEIRAAVVKGE